MNAVDVSVIIPTFNRPESLARTLRGLANAKAVPAQIVVVDQSNDASIRLAYSEVIELYSDFFQSLHYIFQSEPSSTKARNEGMRFANHDILIFADDDIDVHFETVANVSEIMADKSIAMVAGIDSLTNNSSTNIGYLLGTKSFLKRKIGHVTASMLGRYPDNVVGQIETQWAQGFFFAVRKSLLEKWKCGWDENLTSYAYAEDLDFSFGYYKHAKAEGLKCVLDERVVVDHLASLEYRIPNEKSLYMYIINRAYLSHKHGMGIRGYVASAWCNFWRLVEQILGRKHPGIFAKAWFRSLLYRKEIISGDLNYDQFMR